MHELWTSLVRCAKQHCGAHVFASATLITFHYNYVPLNKNLWRPANEFCCGKYVLHSNGEFARNRWNIQLCIKSIDSLRMKTSIDTFSWALPFEWQNFIWFHSEAHFQTLSIFLVFFLAFILHVRQFFSGIFWIHCFVMMDELIDNYEFIPRTWLTIFANQVETLNYCKQFARYVLIK